jgi:tetratricopeptide (TPR) repeat protein
VELLQRSHRADQISPRVLGILRLRAFGVLFLGLVLGYLVADYSIGADTVELGELLDLDGGLTSAVVSASLPRPIVTALDADVTADSLSRGNAAYVRRDYRGALATYLKGLAEHPMSPSLLESSGNTYFSLGRFTTATQYYAQAIAVSGSPAASAYEGRGAARFALHLYADALDDFNSCLLIEPDRYTATYLRGRVYLALSARQLGIADLTRAAELRPTASSPFFYRGRTEATMGDLEQAEADYSSAIGLSSNPNAYSNRARVRELLGKYSLAAADLRIYLSLSPNAADLKDTLDRIRSLDARS